jgi:predicted class III extradiol MEMO1 family dioxygenase
MVHAWMAVEPVLLHEHCIDRSDTAESGLLAVPSPLGLLWAAVTAPRCGRTITTLQAHNHIQAVLLCLDSGTASWSCDRCVTGASSCQSTSDWIMATRTALCTYYSPNEPQLNVEIEEAYHSVQGDRLNASLHVHRHSQLLALIAPHGAACDGFHVAATSYFLLNAHLRRICCKHLTAVLVGTEHRGSNPIALSRLIWSTPLGPAQVDTAAVDYFSLHHNIPIIEAPHATEHSIENQLPFLVHGAKHGWDLAAANCLMQQPASLCTAAASSSSSSSPAAGASHATPEAAELSIVPISIGYLGQQPHLIQQYGAALADLLHHLRQRQQQQQQHWASDAAAGSNVASSASPCSDHQVVLIVTSDFTHAGPWYGELPPAGMTLQQYMTAQDAPLLQALQQGSAQDLLAAAAANRNSTCGLYPLAVALEALYGDSRSSSGGGSSGIPGGSVRPYLPELLEYMPAHLIYSRPDSTGFAAAVVWSQSE